MRIKRVKSDPLTEKDITALNEILERAVWRENYELAAIIRDALEQIICSSVPPQQAR